MKTFQEMKGIPFPSHGLRNFSHGKDIGVPIATLTTKGQITLPVELRISLRLAAGDRVELFYQAGGAVALRPLIDSVQDLKGIVGKRTKPASIEEMDRAIAAAVTQRDNASRG